MHKFFSIGEISKEIGVNTHVIRNWCEKFPNLKIHKGIGGRRYFDEDILDEFKKIKILIEKYGMSIEGIKKLIKYDKIKPDNFLKDINSNNTENQNNTESEKIINMNLINQEEIKESNEQFLKKEFQQDLDLLLNILKN